MVPPTGLEPATLRLKAGGSTLELRGCWKSLEGVTGFEPAFSVPFTVDEVEAHLDYTPTHELWLAFSSGDEDRRSVGEAGRVE